MIRRKSRLFPLLGLCAAILLGACDSQPSQSTPAATSTIAVGPTQVALPGQITNDQQPNTTAPSPQPQVPDQPTPTLTVPPPKEALTLNPVPIETTDATREGAFSQERTINLPPGFHIKVFATGLDGVRWLGLSPEGVVYATVRSVGRVVTLPDADKDGVADEVKTFADDLAGVHGIDFKDGAVYVATEGEIIRLQDTDKDGVADKRDVLASDLPTGGGHSTRTITFGPDGNLYVSVGSSCNVCVEDNPKRAAVLRYSADGKFEKVFAKGLRNAVGIEFHPITRRLWATNNGRDGLGDDVPPETIYRVREDADYGWPYCYGDRVQDDTLNVPPGHCGNTGLPSVKMQAHSAPLGFTFYYGDQFPAQFKGDMFVAFHGSWNRTVPTGYKVVRVRTFENQPDISQGDRMVEDFATGWFLGEDAFGRPVDLLVAPDGSLLLTDDKADAIYSIYYRENAGP